MAVREPIVAGTFYGGSRQECLAQLGQYLPTTPDAVEQIDRPIGAIVPHAGWMCSGAVAGRVFAAIAAKCQPDTFVLFGAAHSTAALKRAVFPSGAWRTPLGDVAIDHDMVELLCARVPGLVAAADAHAGEHSLEVQVPFIQHLCGDAAIVPICVPPDDRAHEMGRAIAEAIGDTGKRVVYVGSTDLTHYGPRYGFTPQGSDADGLRWAKDVNDRRLLALIGAMKADAIVAEATVHHSACGAGAIAAAVAAAVAAGATRAVVLDHTTSAEVLGEQFGAMVDSVGYAGIVFG